MSNNTRARRLVSIALASAFVLISITGITMMFGGHGHGYGAGRQECGFFFMGLCRELHELLGIFIIILAAVHAGFNRRVLKRYFLKS